METKRKRLTLDLDPTFQRRLKAIAALKGVSMRGFAGKAMDEWAYRRGIKLSFIRPGKPVENAFAESFNGRLRDECLNINWFMSVRHAREIIESWRQDYNEVRPHSSLKGKTPKEFAGSMAGLY